jgi:hypothetical protein
LSSDPTLNREFFQKLLASAFAVQESGMKSQSLAAIVELQRSIRAGYLDVDGAMHLVAEWARGVANASGVAMGRLKGDQLIYTAGSGSGASYIGRRVMATFSTSAPNEAGSEILRVENTSTDGRIEAAVCRQFGVKSLLILPIYRGRAVAGVLQVLFIEAHSFQDQEVRTYRILAGLVGEAMSQADVERKRVAAVATEEVIEHLPAPPREPLNKVELVEVFDEQPPLNQTSGLVAKPETILSRQLSPRPTARFLHPTHYLPAYQRERISGLVAASVILAFTWFLYTARPSATSPAIPTAAAGPTSSFAQEPASSSQPSPNVASASSFVTPVPRYQTVRYVAPVVRRKPFEMEGRVKHFGSDVTVRYFTPRPVVVRAAASSEVRHVSDDVTVRYFKPKNTAQEPAPAGAQQEVAR